MSGHWCRRVKERRGQGDAEGGRCGMRKKEGKLNMAGT